MRALAVDVTQTVGENRFYVKPYAWQSAGIPEPLLPLTFSGTAATNRRRLQFPIKWERIMADNRGTRSTSCLECAEQQGIHAPDQGNDFRLSYRCQICKM